MKSVFLSRIAGWFCNRDGLLAVVIYYIMQEEKVILKAEFNPKVKTYWVLAPTIPLVCTIVGIPFLLIWLPIALLVCGRYLASLECVLTDRSVKLKSGVLNRVEKTIPLDKITDLGMRQGPIMRAMDLELLTVETAGSSAPGALASVIGVIDARGFRDAVMRQKELLTEGTASSVAPVDDGDSGVSSAESVELLREIRDSLRRLESRGGK